MATVLPQEFAIGSKSKKIREFLINNYNLDYIVLPVADVAFSESATFKDMLLIATKKKPQLNNVTKIIFLKKSIMDLNNVTEICKKIKMGVYDSAVFDILEVTHSKLIKNKDNLYNLIGFISLGSQKVLEEFNTKIKGLIGN